MYDSSLKKLNKIEDVRQRLSSKLHFAIEKYMTVIYKKNIYKIYKKKLQNC